MNCIWGSVRHARGPRGLPEVLGFSPPRPAGGGAKVGAAPAPLSAAPPTPFPLAPRPAQNGRPASSWRSWSCRLGAGVDTGCTQSWMACWQRTARSPPRLSAPPSQVPPAQHPSLPAVCRAPHQSGGRGAGKSEEHASMCGSVTARNGCQLRPLTVMMCWCRPPAEGGLVPCDQPQRTHPCHR